MDNVSIVILNYNNTKDTIACLDSIISTQKCRYQIILVDNCSETVSLRILEDYIRRNESKNIYLIKNKENLGYAMGNNIGIQYAIDNGAKYIAVLNNDVIVNDTSIEKCVNYLNTHKNSGIVGPAILEIDGNIIQSAGAKINFYKCNAKLLGNGEEYIPSEDVVECDYVGGACLIFRSELIDEIGFLPDKYFLFWEETEWCIKAKEAGKEISCIMSAFVRHKGSATIKSINGLSSYYMERNRILFLKRNANISEIIIGISYLFLRAIIKGIFVDKEFLKYIKFYIDGFFNFDRMKGIRR